MINHPHDNNVLFKLSIFPWKLVVPIIILSSIGFLMLYSAASGSFYPWLAKQYLFFAIFFFIMIFISMMDIKFFFDLAYLLYVLGICLLIIVHIAGHNSMGAVRWIRIETFSIQPSEIMKIFTILALARYFHNVELYQIRRIRYLIVPIIIIIVPLFFILKQPDLGTALILLFCSIVVLFLSGIRIWKFIVTGGVFLLSLPFVWHFFLHEYQKQRILTFINPQKDPLGEGYNIIQSKIAIGSGGLFGKGFLEGSQSQLSFLPEKQTDFIFTMIAEEFGFIGSVVVIFIYCFITYVVVNLSTEIKSQFGRLVSLGIISMFFIHMIVNIGMSIGLMPVVGAPLPLISYGGTITMTTLVGFGLILNAYINKNKII